MDTLKFEDWGEIIVTTTPAQNKIPENVLKNILANNNKIEVSGNSYYYTVAGNRLYTVPVYIINDYLSHGKMLMYYCDTLTPEGIKKIQPIPFNLRDT